MGLPRKIKNFALFHDGVSYAGQVEEATLPKLTRKTEEWRSGGMGGPIKADMGMDGIEMEWTAGGVLREVLNQFGTLKHDGVMLRFAGALQADDSEEIQALEVVVRGRHTEIDQGKAKAGDKTEFTVKSALSYYKLSIDNEVLIEIDLVNMVEVVDGIDRLEGVRNALGV